MDNKLLDIFTNPKWITFKIQLLIDMGVDEICKAEHDVISNDGQLITSFASTT